MKPEHFHHICTMDLKSNWRGVVFSIALGLLSMFIEKYTPSYINGIIIALILGMIVSNTVKLPSNLDSGIGYTSAKMLEFSILFLAVGINYTEIAHLGASSFVGLAVIVLIVLSATYYLSQRFNCPANTGILVGFGTAICGSSAIAALSPSLKNKEKEDVAIAMAVVNLLGTLGMLILPVVLLKSDFSASKIGLLIGGSLHSVGNVAGAGFTIGKEAGDAAITVKLARVALLTPGLIFMNYLVNRNSAGNWKDYFKLPWYLIGFILVTILVSVIEIPKSSIKNLEYIGKIILTIAMAAIGLKVSFTKLLKAGKRGIGFGIVIFGLQLGLLLLLTLI